MNIVCACQKSKVWIFDPKQQVDEYRMHVNGALLEYTVLTKMDF
jgi:hypothetical protein